MELTPNNSAEYSPGPSGDQAHAGQLCKVIRLYYLVEFKDGARVYAPPKHLVRVIPKAELEARKAEVRRKHLREKRSEG